MHEMKDIVNEQKEHINQLFGENLCLKRRIVTLETEVTDLKRTKH